MDTRFQTYFLEIVKQKSLSKAAERLFVGQSTLSQFIAREEKQLGTKLLIRKGGRLELTYAGKLYAKTCEEIQESQNMLFRKISEVKQSQAGLTRLGITPQWGGLIYSAVYPYFKVNYPEYLLKITEDVAHPLLDMLREDRLDMALLALDESLPVGLDCQLICREQLILAVPVSMADGQQDSASAEKHLPQVNMSRFAACPFILSCGNTIIRDISYRMIQSAGFAPNIICEINNHEASLRMVSEGVGIAIVPRCYMKKDPHICYYGVAPGWYWNISVVKRPGYDMTRADQYMIELFRKYYE